jgi:hypothetical protein
LKGIILYRRRFQIPAPAHVLILTILITFIKEAGMKTEDIEKHHETLARFTQVYCREKHRAAPRDGGALCGKCRELLSYACARLEKCPFDPKPKCKDCKAHCYHKEQRERVRDIMRFSGMHFVKRGRLDWLIRYFMM